MNSIRLTLQHQILWVKVVQETTKSILVQDATQLLNRMIAEGSLLGGAFIGINGPCPLVVCFAIAEVICPLYQVVAVFDPKLSGYVIAKSENEPEAIGGLVLLPHLCPPDEVSSKEYSPIKLVLCGAPRSGKSCLKEGLKRSLWDAYREQKGPYPLVIDATPDGEGSWFQTTMENNEGLARALKERYRSDFSEAFVQVVGEAIADYVQPLTMIDMGGKISDENRRLAEGATHVVILWRDRLPDDVEHEFYAGLADWEAFCAALDLEVIAKFKSVLDAPEDEIWCYEPVIEGVIHYLKRGVASHDYPCVQALTQKILALCEES